MNRLVIKDQENGMHPGESLVIIDTKDGEEELFVDKTLVSARSIPVGYPLGTSNGHVLVELPRETMRGKWRVWVEKAQLSEV